MTADPRATALTTWDIDREIVLSRVIAAPRERVFQAWTDPKQIVQWFGPDGFKVESLECDIRVGGRWRFIYTGPDGTRWDNRMVFLRIEPPRLIEMEHGSDKDNDAARFHVTVTFESQSDGKTVLTMRQLHPTKEQRDAGIGFGAVEYGYQTIGKLARHLGVSCRLPRDIAEEHFKHRAPARDRAVGRRIAGAEPHRVLPRKRHRTSKRRL